MSVRVEFRWSEEFLAAVDGVRGDVSRAVWVRRVVERALDGSVVGRDEALRELGAELQRAKLAPLQPEGVPRFVGEPAGSPDAGFGRVLRASSSGHLPSCKCPVCS